METCPHCGEPLVKRPGKRFGIKSVILGIICLVVFVALAIPALMRHLAKSKSSEAQTNLSAISKAQARYYKEHHEYAKTFRELGWKLEGPYGYAYFLPDEDLQPDQAHHGPYTLPSGLQPRVDMNGFVVFAVSNIDSDPSLDVWELKYQKVTIENISNDVLE